MILDLLLRFVVGGIVVSFFAMLGGVLKPKSFAGLLGSAPSVALATLTLTVLKKGKPYAAIEAHSMVCGAVAFFFYASLVCHLLMRKKVHVLATTSVALILWILFAVGLRMIFLVRR